MRQEKLERQREIQKRIETKEEQRKEIKPEQFLASEEEMLRRFRMALANSNKKANPKKLQVEPQFSTKAGSARVYTDMKASIKPTYQEYQEWLDSNFDWQIYCEKLKYKLFLHAISW